MGFANRPTVITCLLQGFPSSNFLQAFLESIISKWRILLKLFQKFPSSNSSSVFGSRQRLTTCIYLSGKALYRSTRRLAVIVCEWSKKLIYPKNAIIKKNLSYIGRIWFPTSRTENKYCSFYCRRQQSVSENMYMPLIRYKNAFFMF